jgi:hypothetical protein
MNPRMEAGPQLDALVDEQFFGRGSAAGWLEAPPAYSVDLAVAVRVMQCERWPAGWALRRSPGGQDWQVVDLDYYSKVVAEAPSPALAICRAALASLQREEETPRVLREPLRGARETPLPEDLARIYHQVPSCLQIRLWRLSAGGLRWRASFGPAADLFDIARRLRRMGFPEARPVSDRSLTDLWLRAGTEEEEQAERAEGPLEPALH